MNVENDLTCRRGVKDIILNKTQSKTDLVIYVQCDPRLNVTMIPLITQYTRQGEKKKIKIKRLLLKKSINIM